MTVRDEHVHHDKRARAQRAAGVPICPGCLEAERVYKRESKRRRLKDPDVRRRAREVGDARRRALDELARRHPHEYSILYVELLAEIRGTLES